MCHARAAKHFEQAQLEPSSCACAALMQTGVNRWSLCTMYRDYTSTSAHHHGDNATSLNAADHPSDAAPSSQRQSHSCATYSSSTAYPTPAPVVQPDVLRTHPSAEQFLGDGGASLATKANEENSRSRFHRDERPATGGVPGVAGGRGQCGSA